MTCVAPPQPVRVLGLFAGIGGLERGVSAGLRDMGFDARLVGLVEGEAFGAACLEAAMRRGALAPCPIWLGDVRDFDAASFRGSVDLVVGGFPCQPASSAGKRRGTSDERWLWPECLRVAADSGARAVFFENVRGLLSVNGGEGFAQVLEGLARFGFDAEWTVFSASAVGAPHRRERVFIYGQRMEHAARECRDGGWDGGPGRRAEHPVAGGSVGDGDGPQGQREAGAAPGATLRSGDVGDAARGDQHGEREGDDAVRGGRVLVETGPRATGAGNLAHGDGGRREGLGLGGVLDGERARGGDDPHGRRGEGTEMADDAGGASGVECGRGTRELADAGRRGLGERADEAELQRLAGRGGPQAARGGGFPLPFPPGPGDRDAWGRILADDPGLAPALPAPALPRVRRVADGVPAELDGPDDVGLRGAASARVHRLRALGNAVVERQARAAFVGLWCRMNGRDA